MKYADLLNVIEEETGKWGRLKKDFEKNIEMSIFLKKAYPVVMFDLHQLDIGFIKKMYTPTLFSDIKNPTTRELKIEEFRLEMVQYLEQRLQKLSIEVRFPYLKIEFISMVKAHQEIKQLNCQSPAMINVILRKLQVT